MLVGGLRRAYLIQVPRRANGERLPLVIYLHGGGGRPVVDARPQGPPWIVIAPEGVDGAWNVAGLPVGQQHKPMDPRVDDLAFLEALIDLAVQREGADPHRVTLGGISLGGMMALLALSKLNHKIHAAAVAISSMPAHIRPGYALPHTTHVLIMNGTEDPLVPYQGGPLGGRRRNPQDRQYDMLPTEAVARDLARMLSLPPNPTVTMLPDPAEDGCRSERWEWRGGSGKGSVTLVKVIGGGHNIPGMSPYLPKFLVGATSKDYDGMRLIRDWMNSLPPRSR